MVPRRQSHRPSWGALALTIALISLFVAACAFPEESFDGSLEGDYYINGFDQQGTEYSGLLTISVTPDPSTYELQWIITGSLQQGTGRLEGNQLLVEWDAVEGFDTTSYGTARYEINENGELRGTRTVAGQDGEGTEEAFPIR